VALCIGAALAVDERLQARLSGLSARESNRLLKAIINAVQPQVTELLEHAL
jgi:hypothetical protein